LMLDVARSALIDARNPPLDTQRTGVFIGLGLDQRTTDFHFRWQMKKRAIEWARAKGLEPDSPATTQWIADLCNGAGPALTADRTLGALGSIVASRVAREFHIGGPSHTICSEDTSGLRAVEVALRALQNGELDVALAGAVDLNGDLRTLIATDATRRYSRSGVALPFDVNADGPVPGEGAACVVLKRLSDAVRDGDRIYSVIRGVGTANAGKSDRGSSLSDASLEALKRAYAEANVPAGGVQLLQTHGSGARDEDLAEAQALGLFFHGEKRSAPCRLGSVAADIGHAGAASGMFSFIAASLCLFHEVIPGMRGGIEPVSYTHLTLPTSP
jgi:acyl transferase domain-containing protein